MQVQSSGISEKDLLYAILPYMTRTRDFQIIRQQFYYCTKVHIWKSLDDIQPKNKKRISIIRNSYDYFLGGPLFMDA